MVKVTDDEVQKIIEDDEERLQMLQDIEKWFGIDSGIDWRDLYSRSMPRVKDDPEGKAYAIYLELFFLWCNLQALNLMEEKEEFCQGVKALKEVKHLHKLPMSGLLATYEQVCVEE